MQIGLPDQYPVTDFLSWHRENRLVLNPDFQRRSVWNPDIRSYLINSILRGFPMPKIYLRTRVDIASQQTVREIIDGQQRIRAILDFASGTLRLNRRAEEFAGLAYEDMEDDLKKGFLSYVISTEQLIDADDNKVLQVFARLNIYSVPLNAAELRNANFNGEFKFLARKLADEFGWLWDKYGIISKHDRVRMLDDQIIAELLGILLDGVMNGGKLYVDKLYSRYDEEFQEAEQGARRLRETISFLDDRLSEVLQGDFFSRSPQFLILFAAVAHKLFGIPRGDLKDALPDRRAHELLDLDRAREHLGRLATSVAVERPAQKYVDFVRASSGATIRISSRRVRFLHVWEALTGAK